MSQKEKETTRESIKKEILGILMDSTFYLDLSLEDRQSLANYIFGLYVSKKGVTGESTLLSHMHWISVRGASVSELQNASIPDMIECRLTQYVKTLCAK